ncbi:MAG: rhodanese-like domain-containing protein [Verrucomicrobia bacterium]|nr:rhodanese-like domain-containing protein [Verrucomicrobiota bacterium]
MTTGLFLLYEPGLTRPHSFMIIDGKLSDVIRQTLVVVMTALCLGTVANIVSPRRLPWSQDWANRVHDAATAAGLRVVDLTAAQQFAERGEGFILDARPLAIYGQGHLPGAFSLPASTLAQSFPEIEPMLTTDMHILVYCSGKECEESMELGTFLLSQGFTNISLFVGGYAEWTEAQTRVTP